MNKAIEQFFPDVENSNFMDKKLTEIIMERQLVSVMNQTKWRELCQELAQNNELDPDVRLKYLYSDQVFGFSPVWWNEVLREASAIEWLDFNPIKLKPRYGLIPAKETDISNEIIQILKKYNIPYSVEQSYIRVWGYFNQAERSVVFM